MVAQRVIVEVNMSMLDVNVTSLFPGEEYHLSVVAASEASDVRASSNSSAMVFVLTHTTGSAQLPNFTS